MSKLELNHIYLQIQWELNQLDCTVNNEMKKIIKSDAKEAILLFKSDIDSWVTQLYERKMACYELENLLKLKSDELKLTNLRNNYQTEAQFNEFKLILMRIIAKSISNTFLNNLFKSKNEDVKYTHIEQNI